MAVRLDSIEEEQAPVRLADIPDEDAGVAANLAAIDAQREAQAIEEPTTFAYLFNRIKKGAAGFLGMPGDIVQAVRTAPPAATTPAAFASAERAGAPVTGPVQPTPAPIMATSGQYREGFGVDPEMKTGRDWLRYTGGVAEMAGAGGPFALASKPATLLPLVTSTVGSGLGMEAGGDVASGLGLSRQAGEAVGALAGGVGFAVGPNVASDLYGRVRGRFSPQGAKAAGEATASREIAHQLESYPQGGANIQRSLEISDEVSGFAPSLPARSGAPGLLAEETLLAHQNPSTLNKAVALRDANQKAVADYVNTKFPKVGGETAIARVGKLAQASEARLTAIKTQIDDKLDDAVRVFEANPSNFENGQRLRDLLFKQKEVYSGMRSQKYQAVYEAAERLGVKANIDDAVSYVDDVLKNEMNAYQKSEIPSVFRQLKNEFAKEAEKAGPTIKTTPTGKQIKLYDTKPAAAPEAAEVSFEKLHSLYKRTNSDLASLRGSARPDKDFQTMLLEGLKTKLTDKIKGFEAEGFGEVATKLKEANRFYAQEYVPRFKQGFGQDVLARHSSGEFRTPDQLVTELITKRPNNTQAAKDFNMLFSESPEAMSSLRAGYLDELYRSGGMITKEGRINQRGLETFLRRHEPTLSEFPQIRKELQQLSLDNGALLERRAYIVNAEKELAAHDLYKLFRGKEPDVVLAEATTKPNTMRALAFQARNDPNVAKGLARGIAEHVTKQSDPMAYLTANEEAIRVGLAPLGKQHFENLKTAVEAMTINSRSRLPEAVSSSILQPHTIEQKVGSSPRAIIASLMSVARGRTGTHQEAAFLIGRKFDQMSRAHRAVAMEAVFYDKDTAKAIANLARNPTDKAKIDFATQMMSLGVRTEVAGQGQESPNSAKPQGIPGVSGQLPDRRDLPTRPYPPSAGVRG